MRVDPRCLWTFENIVQSTTSIHHNIVRWVWLFGMLTLYYYFFAKHWQHHLCVHAHQQTIVYVWMFLQNKTHTCVWQQWFCNRNTIMMLWSRRRCGRILTQLRLRSHGAPFYPKHVVWNVSQTFKNVEIVGCVSAVSAATAGFAGLPSTEGIAAHSAKKETMVVTRHFHTWNVVHCLVLSAASAPACIQDVLMF